MLERREFLKHASLLPLASTLGASSFASEGRKSDHILVVVELNGGNDGINTVVPIRDEGYAQHRTSLRIAREDLLSIDDELGLHPQLKGLASLYERSELAVVQGVGYPNPNLSHEVSLATWHTARLDRVGRKGTGWLGRVLDGHAQRTDGTPSALLAGPHAMPPALRSRRSSVAAVPSLDEYLEAGELEGAELFELAEATRMGDHIRRVLLDARATAAKLQSVVDNDRAVVKYPSTKLAADLGLIATLIRAGLGTPVYYAIQPGYDTHALQLTRHADRMKELGDALLAFQNDLRAAGQHERVLVMVFSEFGRRVQENASRGTDHGTAGPVFLIGPGVQPGIHGQAPSLTDLADGNLKSTVDLRRVYSTLLHGWLNEDAARVLGAPVEPLSVLRA